MNKLFVHQEGPTLQSTTRTGKKKYWRGKVCGNEANEVFIVKVWWQDKGAVQSSTPYRVKGKNLGKANETSPLHQALFDLNSLYTKQRDKGYSQDGSKTHIPMKPMLAHSYDKRGHNIEFPAFVQPKLDGFRMMTDGTNAWTRGAKAHVTECVEHLLFDTGGVTLDGELILPGNRPLQETARAAKKFRPGISDTLEYWVYDIVSAEDFWKRSDQVLELLDGNVPSKVRTVPTYIVNDESELTACHAEFIAQGFEGTMIRNRLGKYDHNRSPNLQKLKDFQDDEFKVMAIIDGKGSFKGKAIVVCETPTGARFNVTPQGTMDYREQIFTNRTQYIGRFLTVKYQTLSEDGIPLFPIGIVFRDEGTF